jgi:hypothetical protein
VKGEKVMTTKNPETLKMLAELIEASASGKKVVLKVSPTREVIKIRRGGQDVENVILSMGYSGTAEGKPFSFQKNYSLANDDIQHALGCLLIANNRLQMDYDRLREAGIEVKDEFFTFQNSFMGVSGDASVKRPALRLQDFIHLSRTGAPVSVEIHTRKTEVVMKQEGIDKKGVAYVADFVFTTGDEKTTIEKVYTLGSYNESKEYQEEIKAIANKRLERDCERLRRAGMQVDKFEF